MLTSWGSVTTARYANVVRSRISASPRERERAGFEACRREGEKTRDGSARYGCEAPKRSKVLWGLTSLWLMSRRCARPGMFPQAAGLRVECPLATAQCPGAFGWAPTLTPGVAGVKVASPKGEGKGERGNLEVIKVPPLFLQSETRLLVPSIQDGTWQTVLDLPLFACLAVGYRGESQVDSLPGPFLRFDEAPSQVSE